MEKKHLTNDQVAHYWANQSYEGGSNSSRSFWFDGPNLWSYHTKVAKLHGNDVALFDVEGYSVTTQKQVGKAFRAASHKVWMKVLTVDPVTEKDHAGNLDNFSERIEEHLLKSSRARTNKALHYDRAVRLVEEHNRYVDLFDLDLGKISIDQFDVGEIKKQADAARKLELEEEKRRKEAIREANAENLRKWLSGRTNYLNAAHLYPVMLRVVDGGKVNTSKGVTIGNDTARKLWAFIQKMKGKAWKSNGQTFRIEHYRLDSVSKEGDIKAGCHSIGYAEMERIAEQLGF